MSNSYNGAYSLSKPPNNPADSPQALPAVENQNLQSVYAGSSYYTCPVSTTPTSSIASSYPTTAASPLYGFRPTHAESSDLYTLSPNYGYSSTSTQSSDLSRHTLHLSPGPKIPTLPFAAAAAETSGVQLSNQQGSPFQSLRLAQVDERSNYSSLSFLPPHGTQTSPGILGHTESGQQSIGIVNSSYRAIRSKNYLLEASMKYHSNMLPVQYAPYPSVRVLLLHWEFDGDLPGCTDEVAQLETRFRQDLWFKTKTFKILESHTEKDIMDCISSFFAGTRKDDLMIVYYAGHAYRNPFQLQSSIQKDNMISWHKIRSLLLSFHSNLLLVMDCCHAMASILEHSRTKFIIAACGADQYAAKPGPHSFTLYLLEALPLVTHNYQVPVSAAELYEYISARMKQNPNPWYHQDPHVAAISGAGDVWLGRVSPQSNAQTTEPSSRASATDKGRDRKKKPKR